MGFISLSHRRHGNVVGHTGNDIRDERELRPGTKVHADGRRQITFVKAQQIQRVNRQPGIIFVWIKNWHPPQFLSEKSGGVGAENRGWSTRAI